MKMTTAVIAILAMTLIGSPSWAYTSSKNSAEIGGEKKETAKPAVLQQVSAVPVIPAVKVAPAAKVVPPAAKITPAVEVPVAAPPAVPEVLEKFKAIESQVQWVAKLKKQLEGETSQLNEMRRSMAQSFGLDVKKLENDGYKFDSKSGKFVEK